MKVVFDYDKCTIKIIDGSYEKSFHIRDVKTPKGKPSIKYAAIWPLLVFNYILKECYPYIEDNYLDVATDIEEGIDSSVVLPNDYYQIIGKSVNYLNEVVLKDFDRLRIDNNQDRTHSEPCIIDIAGDKKNKYESRSKYRTYNLGPESAGLVIEWDIRSTNLEYIKQYGVDETWMESSLVVEEKNPESPGEVISSTLYDEVHTARHIGARKSAGVVWNDKIISKLIDLFSGDISKIDARLLPSVSIGSNPEPKKNLKTFILDDYIDRTKFKNENSFAMLEGDMGCGKSYSLFSVARAMYEAGHIVLTLPLYSLYGERGQNSLISYICQHMLGGAGMSPIQKVRSLLSKATDDQKVMIIIDSVDEVFPGVYSDLAREMVKIIEVGNPNVYILLAGRQCSLFMENSGFENIGCVNIRCNDIRDDALTYNDRDLAEIMKNYPDTRTPLFISYFREVKGMHKDKMRKINLSEYGDEIDFREINNYYDLFRARTALLESHSLKDTGTDEVFSFILPYLAFILYTEKRRLFDQADIDSIDAITFDGTTPRERVDVLLNTGIIKRSGSENKYVFGHIEYMHFLAAQYAAVSIEYKDKNEILDEAIKRTSYYSDGSYSRVEKMRFLPFAYYLFLDIVSRKENGKKKKDFDYRLYQLGANVVFEGRDLWDEMRPLTLEYLEYYRSKIINGKEENETYEKPELVDAVNIVAYTTINIVRNKRYDRNAMLRDIHQDLMTCVAIVVNNILEVSDCTAIKDISLGKKWDDNYCMEAMKFIMSEVKSSDLTKWKYRPDLIGRLYSNIGACILAEARLKHDKVLLAKAMEYHKMAKSFREEVVSEYPEIRNEVSLIRSNITIGTDCYYYGLWEEDAEKSISFFTDAINLYHNEALRLQGIDPLKEYSCDIAFPIERTPNYEEDPQIGAEAYVIWLLIAGCYYMCYKIEKDKKNEAAQEHYLKEQYRALCAAFVFIEEDCCDEGEPHKYNKTKLELNAHEIDKIWSDVTEKYIYSFADCKDEDISKYHELLRKIMHLYTSLHEQSEIEDISYENGCFTVCTC